MRRREVIGILGGVVLARSLTSTAQQEPTARCLGVLSPAAPPDPLVEAIRDELRDLGYTEGRDVVFQVLWAEGKLDRLNELAAELVGLKVDVIITLSTPAALAARKATTTIPIVFTHEGAWYGSMPTGYEVMRRVPHSVEEGLRLGSHE
jgi:putative tryptophan/tyrosine transport system substrate-binding protein